MSELTQTTVLAHSRKTFALPGFASFAQRWRPLICPFEVVIEEVPDGSRVLDIGSGPGLWLQLLAVFGKLQRGVGFDSNPKLIEVGEEILRKHELSDLVELRYLPVQAPWPDGDFNVLTMIDVMHHIPVADRAGVIQSVADRLPKGGLFIYKDMAAWPDPLSVVNQAHDLLLARQWINHQNVDTLQNMAFAAGLKLVKHEKIRRYLYVHDFCVFEKV